MRMMSDSRSASEMNLEAMLDIQVSEGITIELVEGLMIEVVARLRLLQGSADSTATIPEVMKNIQDRHDRRAEEIFDRDLIRVLDTSLEDDVRRIARSNEANGLELLRLACEILARLRSESFRSLFREKLGERADLFSASESAAGDEDGREDES